jgi:hypothetical protein
VEQVAEVRSALAFSCGEDLQRCLKGSSGSGSTLLCGMSVQLSSRLNDSSGVRARAARIGGVDAAMCTGASTGCNYSSA